MAKCFTTMDSTRERFRDRCCARLNVFRAPRGCFVTALLAKTPFCHREERGDVATSWRTLKQTQAGAQNDRRFADTPLESFDTRAAVGGRRGAATPRAVHH